MCPPDSRSVTKREAVRVWLLGGFRVSVGSRTIQQDEWHLRKAAALVKLLALAPGHRVHREQVIDLFWPDSGRGAASNSLRKTLHAARKVLAPTMGARYLASEDESLMLCPAGDLWVDVGAFEEATTTARRAREPAAYRAALDLYAGDLLPGDRYEEWTEEKREELRRTLLSLHIELARLYEERGEYERGIEALLRAATEEPTLEEVHAGLMRLYALSGRRRDALQQYERLREALDRELAAEPDATTRQLHDDIAAGRFPPVQSAGPPQSELPDAGKHNLPAPRTSFVGREREMVEIKRELAMTRLLTLTGAGGSGKTRLALEVARDLDGAYPDGVWLVELAPLSEGALVPQAVAQALGVQEHPGRPLSDVLVDAVRRQEMLLVMDNCEHLIEAAAHLIDTFLDACPHLRILATSREPLGTVGEVNWLVSPLSVPSTQRVPTIEHLDAHEATRLFVQRASAKRSNFLLRPENALAVANICRRLDGLPLAIELAAARVGALSVEQLSERLANSLGLLTGGARTVVPRQRTLKATLDWSHELLGEQERALFRRLSTFMGGWTLEAAYAVGAGEGVSEDDVVDLLSALVDKSLVMTEAVEDRGIRYRMLEPVRQYALEKVKGTEEIETIKRRYAAFFLGLAEEAALAFPGPQEIGWAIRLEDDHDNLRRALSWSLESGEDTVLGLRIASALAWFWRGHGHLGEGVRWLEKALSEDDGAAPTARAGALHGLGIMLEDWSDLARSEAAFEEALALYEKHGDAGRVAQCLATLGWTAILRGDSARAKAFFDQSLVSGQSVENRRDIPRILSGLAAAAFGGGDLERARGLWEEAATLHRLQGESLGVAAVLAEMGYSELALGNQERAKALLEETLAMGRKLNNKQTVGGSLLCLGIAAVLGGDPERAETLLKDSLAINRELESKADIAEGLEGLAEVATVLSQHARAARLWGSAATLRQVSRPWVSTERMLHEPQLAAARSRLDEATWEAAFTEGKTMGLEEAVEYALSEEEPLASTPAPQQPSPDQGPTLTDREEEVAVLVGRGITNRQIAAELHLSEHTAATHVRRILKKLGLRSRSQIGSWMNERRSSSSDLD